MAKVRHIGGQGASNFFYLGKYANYDAISAIPYPSINSYAYAENSQGVWLINYKSDGFYIFDGLAWKYTSQQTLNQIISDLNSKLKDVTAGDWIDVNKTIPTIPVINSLTYISYLSVSTPSFTQNLTVGNGFMSYDHLPQGYFNRISIHHKAINLAIGQSKILRFALYRSDNSLIVQGSKTLTSADNGNVFSIITLPLVKNVTPDFVRYCIATTDEVGNTGSLQLRGENATAENDANWLGQFTITGAFPSSFASLSVSSLNFKAQMWLHYSN